MIVKSTFVYEKQKIQSKFLMKNNQNTEGVYAQRKTAPKPKFGCR